MGLFSRSTSPSQQLLFVTDLHGSTVAFRKMLNAYKAYGVQALICGGDVAGKRLYPIVERSSGRFEVHGGHEVRELDGHAALADAKTALEASGGYAVHLAPDELERVSGDPEAADELFTRAVIERLEEWMALAEDRLAGTGVQCFITGGNDDTDEMLAPLRDASSDVVVASEGRVVEVLGQPMVSLGWSNPTPWQTPRETSEEELARMLDAACREVAAPEEAIWNVHVPPKDSTLDSCPRLDTCVFPPVPVLRGGEPEMHGAGSSAVADAIRLHQPLLTLHGHIHESTAVSKIGRTVCINPGSEYQDAQLLGAIVSLQPGKVANYQLTRG